MSSSHPTSPGLRRELGILSTVALSISGMGPTLGVALNGVTPAALVGKSVPLVFLIAAVAVGLVGYGFVRMSRHITHAGSVYALTGATLGPRVGFLAGWALLFAYLSFVVLVEVAVGIFGEIFLQQTGIYSGSSATVITIATGVLAWALAVLDVRALMRSFLVLEGIGVLAVIVTTVIIFVKIANGSAPGHANFTPSVFELPTGAGTAGLGLAVVFGFLSFAGFESSLSLGEEARRPRKAIPIALSSVVAFGALYYVVVFAAQTMGFGTDAKGIAAFAASGSPLADLAQSFAGTWLSAIINLCIALSALVTSIGMTAAAGRLLFAFARDGFGPRRLASTSVRTGAPIVAVTVVSIAAFAYTWGTRFLAATSLTDVFLWSATIGTLAILVAYVFTSIGATSYLARVGKGARKAEAILPGLGCVILLFVLWNNVYPIPAAPYTFFPYLVIVWLLIGVAIVVFVPGLARRIGSNLASSIRSADNEEPSAPDTTTAPRSAVESATVLN